MSQPLDKWSVLILNKHWIPINTTSPRHSFALMYAEKARGIWIEGGDVIPLEWSEWCEIRISDTDKKIKTVNGNIKIPNVIVLNVCDKIPKQTMKFTQKKLWERDKFTCQYSGKPVTLATGNIDHVLPRSQGGKTSWENCVIAHKEINAIKADRTPEQAGLKLLKTPVAPKIMPVSFYIKNKEKTQEWDMFLGRS